MTQFAMAQFVSWHTLCDGAICFYVPTGGSARTLKNIKSAIKTDRFAVYLRSLGWPLENRGQFVMAGLYFASKLLCRQITMIVLASIFKKRDEYYHNPHFVYYNPTRRLSCSKK